MSVTAAANVPDDPSRGAMELDVDATRDLVRRVTEHALGVLGPLGQRPIMPDPATRDAAVRDMLQPPDSRPGDLPELLARLDRAAACAAEVHDPGFFAYTPVGGLVASAVGEIYAQLVSRYVGLSEAAPAFAAMEHGVIRWLAGVAGLPAGSGGLLLSGGSMANFTAVATAPRRADSASRPGTVYLGSLAHHSLFRAARLVGVPADRIRVIRQDADLRLDVSSLERAIRDDREAGRTPSLLVGTAGTTATGAVDPLPELAAIARREGAWFHVDGAYGGLFRLTERGRAITAGMELADSVTLNPHKGLFLSAGTGALVVRDVDRLRAAHAADTGAIDDVPKHDDLPDFADLGMELTREARGPRLWLPLHLYGTAAFRDALDEKLDLARTAYERLADSPVLEVPWRPGLSVVAFRIPAHGDVAAANALNERLMAAVNASGRVLLSSVVLDGVLTLRMCILSQRTHLEHLEAALDIIEARARELSPKPRGIFRNPFRPPSRR